MNTDIFAIKGHLIRNVDPKRLEVLRDSWIVCENRIIKGIFPVLPERYVNIPVKDYGNRLIIPGLVDLHLHAPQYSFRGLGMDLELLQWLENYAFPEESKYVNLDYADKAYKIFVSDLVSGATTKACVFGTVHTPATLLLMDMLEESGMSAMVGRVNMDRNCPDTLREQSDEHALAYTQAWLDDCQKYKNISPILTPRFIPACSDKLMSGLGELQRKTGLPVQSHLSENLTEIRWVAQLCPESNGYADAYRRFGLLGGENCPTIMAHCVYSDAAELTMLKDNGVYLAHCPTSNTNLSSGIAPIRTWLDMGLNCGLGSDIAGGHSLSIFQTMAHAIQVSKLRWRIQDDTLAPLTVPEVFYMATKGGGSFFGNVGDLAEGYDFDVVVLDDSSLPSPYPLSQIQRLERIVYQSGSDDLYVHAKYCAGRLVKN